MKATNKVKAVPAALKKAGIAHPTTPQMVSFCVACFSDVMSASATLENAKALWDAARVSPAHRARPRVQGDRARKGLGFVQG
jgi:hypothetical protein